MMDPVAEHHQQPMTRTQLADVGQQQLLLMLRTSKQLLDAYSNIQPTTDQQLTLQELQQSYLQVSQQIRNTLQQCQALEQQEAAAAAATEQGSAEQDVVQLEARAADLRRQLERQNQLVKQVIDKLRHLVDAFNMWDSHERHLVQHSVQYAVAGTSGPT